MFGKSNADIQNLFDKIDALQRQIDRIENLNDIRYTRLLRHLNLQEEYHRAETVIVSRIDEDEI
jgi:hypothetical protein